MMLEETVNNGNLYRVDLGIEWLAFYFFIFLEIMNIILYLHIYFFHGAKFFCLTVQLIIMYTPTLM